jgi:hypothetical protein
VSRTVMCAFTLEILREVPKMDRSITRVAGVHRTPLASMLLYLHMLWHHRAIIDTSLGGQTICFAFSMHVSPFP